MKASPDSKPFSPANTVTAVPVSISFAVSAVESRLASALGATKPVVAALMRSFGLAFTQVFFSCRLADLRVFVISQVIVLLASAATMSSPSSGLVSVPLQLQDDAV